METSKPLFCRSCQTKTHHIRVLKYDWGYSCTICLTWQHQSLWEQIQKEYTNQVIAWFKRIIDANKYNNTVLEEMKERCQDIINTHYITESEIADLGNYIWEDWEYHLSKRFPAPDINDLEVPDDVIDWDRVGKFLVDKFSLNLYDDDYFDECEEEDELVSVYNSFSSNL